jgi:hypothetical protein
MFNARWETSRTQFWSVMITLRKMRDHFLVDETFESVERQMTTKGRHEMERGREAFLLAI